MHIFNSVTVVAWVAFWAYWFISALRTRSENKRREPFQSRWLYWILLIIAYWLILSNSAALSLISWRFIPGGISLKIVGLIILFTGLGFAVWARVHLGQYWSGRITIKVGHRLIRTGPYKIVRHPIYTGILFGFIGTAFVMGEIRVWLAIILVLISFMIKISVEEKFLLEEFGQEYNKYMREVKMLIPYII